jgi:hypothetical protein
MHGVSSCTECGTPTYQATRCPDCAPEPRLPTSAYPDEE